jgi:hypothetical protein
MDGLQREPSSKSQTSEWNKRQFVVLHSRNGIKRCLYNIYGPFSRIADVNEFMNKNEWKLKKQEGTIDVVVLILENPEDAIIF